MDAVALAGWIGGALVVLLLVLGTFIAKHTKNTVDDKIVEWLERNRSAVETYVTALVERAIERIEARRAAKKEDKPDGSAN